MEPKLIVYNADGPAGMVDAIDTVQWMDEYKDVGEIKILCAATGNNLALLQQWRLVYNPDTPNIVGLITYVKKSLSDKGKLQIEARGSMSVCRWAQRIVYGSISFSDAAEGIMTLARDNLRGLPVTVGYAGITASCSETIKWGSVLAGMKQLASAGGLGFHNFFDPLTMAESLVVDKGMTRISGSEYRGYFGTEMQNISDAQIVQDGHNYSNVAVCVGATDPDHVAPAIITVGQSVDAARRELYVDCSSVSYSYRAADGTQKQYTDAEYAAALTSKGALALLDHYNTQSIKATTQDISLVYGTDYDLGDILPVRMPELGIYAKARVEAITITYDKNGRTVRPTFGDFSAITGG